MEPVYDYVPGSGWVATYVPHREILTYDKVRYRIEFRKPNPGELFRYTFSSWSIDKWAEWCRNTSADQIGLRAEHYQHVMQDTSTSLSVITIIRL